MLSLPLLTLRDLLPKFDVAGTTGPEEQPVPAERQITKTPLAAGTATEEDTTEEVKKYEASDPLFERYAIGGRFGFSEVAACVDSPACWALETLGGEINESIDSATYKIPDNDYAGAVIVKSPPKDAALIFPKWEGENPRNYEVMDITLPLMAGTEIELIADAKSKINESNIDDKGSLKDQTVGAIRFKGKSSKVSLFYAGDAALVEMIEGGIKTQMAGYGRWQETNDARAWEPPTLGVLPDSLTKEDQELFEQIGVKQKPDDDFTLSRINDLVGDSLQLSLAGMWRNAADASLKFLVSLPDVNEIASTAMEDLLLQKFGFRGNASETYIVFFERYVHTKADSKLGAPFSIVEGERRQADGDNLYEKSEVYSVIRMDRLAIGNFPSGDNGIAETIYRLNNFSILAPYFNVGIYTWTGADSPAIFDSKNRIQDSRGKRIKFIDFYREFRKVDVQKKALKAIEDFFFAGKKEEHAHRLKEIYALRLLREAKNMGSEAYDLASAVLDPESKNDKSLHIETLDVYEYDVLDALIVYRKTDSVVVLYMMPQKNYKNRAFYIFKNMQSFKEYIHSITIHTEPRNNFLARFKAEDRIDDSYFFFTRDGFYTHKRGADYHLKRLPGAMHWRDVSEDGWTYETKLVRSDIYEINQKSARSRDIKNNPFLRMADMFQRYVESAVKVSMFSHDEYESNVRTRIVSDVTQYAGILTLLLFKVIPPWLSVGIGVSTATPGLGGGVRQYLMQDRPADRTKGLVLAIESGLELLLGGFPMNKHKDNRKLVASKKDYDDLVAKHGADKTNVLMKVIHLDPDLVKQQGMTRIMSDPVERLLEIPEPLQEAARQGSHVVDELVGDLRTKIKLINNSPELNEAGKRAKILTILKAQNKEAEDKLYEMFAKIDLPEDVVGDADDLLKKLLNEARDDGETNLLAFSKQESNNDKLLEAKKLTQQDIQELSDDLRYPEMFVGDRENSLKGFHDPNIFPGNAQVKSIDDVYTINGKQYVFIDDMAVRINTIKNVDGRTFAILPPGGSSTLTIQRVNGKWRMVEPKLLGGAPPRHDIGLGSSQLSSLHVNGENFYRLKLPDASKPIDVVFDLTICRWVEADGLGGIKSGGKEFVFSPAIDSTPEIWKEYTAGDSLLKPATTQMRADALEQFGLGREVPPIPKYPVPRFYNSQEPPRVIHKIWIGDRAISEANIQKLRRTLVQAGSSKFELRLHLDISDPVAHEKTMAILKPLIDDGLKVVELKSENFFNKFQSEKYFDQYKFYLERDNLNYAGATNVLRYRMIYHEGGIYSDMDDVLMGPLDIGKIKNGDVVVFPPFEGLGFEYNNSFFGSSKKNPTLDKLSNESYKKFQGNRNEIKNRPYFDHSKSKDKQSDRFYRYMKIRSETDGPALFSSVVSETIPARGAFKAWKKILGRKGIAVSGDLEDRYLDASRNFEALDGVYDVGADHTSL
ncbi:dermonecrotic toxin domain-containing protein [Herbaspirillum sp. RV1423]|uniref:dermonecrotic toxin domain-containing protein n=1 Tax=Herbaspirillum sp. RV1423 TaxID=1443993 RepID=UPI0004B9ABD1|nr:DUF6543 domain-containing protein [Herbaspirillum sp. RV1423]